MITVTAFVVPDKELGPAVPVLERGQTGLRHSLPLFHICDLQHCSRHKEEVESLIDLANHYNKEGAIYAFAEIQVTSPPEG